MCSQAQSIKEAEAASELYLSTRAFDDFEGGDLEVADKKEALRALKMFVWSLFVDVGEYV